MRAAVPIALLALAACAAPPPPSAGAPTPLPPLRLAQEAPRLALLEQVLGDYFASDIAVRPTLCVAVNDGRSEEALPPDDEVALIERFPRLAPMSRCTQAHGGWRDAETEQPAMVFALHSFTCAGAGECSGWVSYTTGNTGSPAALYRARWETGTWAITRDERELAQ